LLAVARGVPLAPATAAIDECTQAFNSLYAVFHNIKIAIVIEEIQEIM
jgi:hypothetical protein